jgi:hypothetical protein
VYNAAILHDDPSGHDEILHVAVGWSQLNERHINFFDPLQISSKRISFSKRPVSGGTLFGESPTPTRYTDALKDLTSYIYYNDKLKLFYNNNKNYLLYKLIQQ